MFSLTVDNTGESRYFLFNEHLDATMGLNNVRKASPHSCMRAINTSSTPTAATVMLFRVHWFVADDTRRTFVGAKLYLQGWRLPGAGASIFWPLKHENSDPQPRTLLLGCMFCAPVCEVDCDRNMACSVGVSMKLL